MGDNNKILSEISQFLDEQSTPQDLIGCEATPPHAPPAMDQPSNPAHNPSPGKMELYGYRSIECDAPDQELVKKIWNFFDSSSKITGGSTTYVEGNKECETLLQSGVQEMVSHT
jgi:hypothetical protein